MTPGPNDLVVSPSEAGTMLSCHSSAPSLSPPPYTHTQQSAYVLKGLQYWTFRDFWTWMYSTNVMDVEYLRSKFFSIGHKQNILSFSHPRSSGLLWNDCLLWTSPGRLKSCPSGWLEHLVSGSTPWGPATVAYAWSCSPFLVSLLIPFQGLWIHVQMRPQIHLKFCNLCK